MPENKPAIGSNMEKVDAYVNGPEDYAEIPELTDEDFARATFMINGVPAKRGRPAPNGAKQQITLRLDQAVIKGFKATGQGWQGRMNEALHEWLNKRSA